MIELAVIMDPIENIKPTVDSTFALLLTAQRRNWTIHYIKPSGIYLSDSIVIAQMQKIKVYDNTENYFEFIDATPIARPLHSCDFSLLRKDPPFDLNYLHLTYILEQAKKQDHLILNCPTSVRDANEKIFATHFSQCCPPTLVASDFNKIHAFLSYHKKAVLKPIESMGGDSIFLVDEHDFNKNVILETLTQGGKKAIIIQAFIPEVLTQGDKRILMINGKPYPYALRRMPQKNDIRANLRVGGTGLKSTLTQRDEWICEQVGPVLQEKDLLFVGLDVIGEYLTEINVTSPTGIRQIERLTQLDVSESILDAFIERLQRNR